MKKKILLILALSLCIFTSCRDRAAVITAGEETSYATATETETCLSAKDTEAPALCAVHICGAVVSPGVYELPEGSLRQEALSMAGGFEEDAAQDYVNLAERVRDGEQLYIPRKEELLALGPVSVEEAQMEKETSGLVNINTATREELMTLPGIGEKKAADIIAYRESVGAFMTPEDIKQISGIKDGLYQKISSLITVN